MSNALQNMLDVCQQGSKVQSIATVLGIGNSETPESLAQTAQAQASLAALTRDSGGSSVVQQPLSALRAVQSSLRAHIDDAKQIATHGQSVSLEHIDRVMKGQTRTHCERFCVGLTRVRAHISLAVLINLRACACMCVCSARAAGHREGSCLLSAAPRRPCAPGCHRRGFGAA